MTTQTGKRGGRRVRGQPAPETLVLGEKMYLARLRTREPWAVLARQRGVSRERAYNAALSWAKVMKKPFPPGPAICRSEMIYQSMEEGESPQEIEDTYQIPFGAARGLAYRWAQARGRVWPPHPRFARRYGRRATGREAAAPKTEQPAPACMLPAAPDRS